MIPPYGNFSVVSSICAAKKTFNRDAPPYIDVSSINRHVFMLEYMQKGAVKPAQQ